MRANAQFFCFWVITIWIIDTWRLWHFRRMNRHLRWWYIKLSLPLLHLSLRPIPTNWKISCIYSSFPCSKFHQIILMFLFFLSLNHCSWLLPLRKITNCNHRFVWLQSATLFSYRVIKHQIFNLTFLNLFFNFILNKLRQFNHISLLKLC